MCYIHLQSSCMGSHASQFRAEISTLDLCGKIVRLDYGSCFDCLPWLN